MAKEDLETNDQQPETEETTPKVVVQAAPEHTDFGIIRPRQIHDEMSESYLDYAMSVIVARALPDVRDGLKPVQRRILYVMREMGLSANSKHQKCAKIVGQVMGLYHPHGDSSIYEALARMAQWWSLRMPLVNGQGNFGCFTKDTEVLLTDGRHLSFENLVKEHRAGKKNYTYTVNKSGSIVVGEILHPRLTQKQANLVEVKLDNGARIRCTPNHRFMLKDGSYEEAQNLVSGQSLMPLYQKLSTAEDRLNREGYQLIYQNKTKTWVPAHHIADNYNLAQKSYPKSRGRVRHHVDFNKLNNNPDNIIRVGWGEHWEIHYQHAIKQHSNEEYRQKIAAGRAKFWSDPKNRQKYSSRMSELNLKNWQDPAYQKKMRLFLSAVNKEYVKNHPEHRLELAARGSKTLKRLWQEPAYKQIFHDKIVASNQRRATNLTGKSKFLNVCKAVLNERKALGRELYEAKRAEIYSYGGATKWETGLEKYYSNDPNLVLFALNQNHKVVSVQSLEVREDVYDLTVDGTHNFALADGIFVHNSMDGDPAAAMRYTEAKLVTATEALLADIDKDTVDFQDNYDGTHREPVVLPARLPNLLINGSQGIAVGLATNIPPHNVGEIIDGLLLLQEKPEADIDELIDLIKGPDFPTGGIAYGQNDIKEALSTGRGRVVVRGRAEIQEEKNRSRIIISELPYQTNKATFVTHIADLVKSKRIEGISDLRDESDQKDGVRVVVELKVGAMASKILNQLYELTELQSVVHYNLVALVDGIQPRLLNIIEVLSEFLAHRIIIVTRRTEYDLKIAKARAHILEGLKIALDHLDAIIKLIRASKDREEAKSELKKQFELSELQANAILDMRLSQLANLERQRIYDEYDAVMKLIADLEDILAKPARIQKIIKDELLEMKAKFNIERKTEIRPEALGQMTAIDLIPEESVLISLTRGNYVKRLPADTYKSQQRGGKGVIGMQTREDDAVVDIVFASTHDDIMFFTDAGRVFTIKAYEIPASSRQSKGVALPNLIRIEAEEKVTALITMPDRDRAGFFFFATRLGVVKRVATEAFKNVRKSGVVAIGLKPKDVLLWVKRTSGSDEIAQMTKNGQVILYNESEARAMGRSASGVRGMRLKGDDEIIETTVLTEDSEAICVISKNGIGKKVDVKEFRNQHRGGSGIRIAKLNPKTGLLAGGTVINKQSKDLIIVSDSGQVIRIPIASVKRLSRQASGVILMRSSGNDKVVSMTVVDDSDEPAEAEEAAKPKGKK